MAVDPQGNVTAIWRQHDGTRFNVWSNRYTIGGGWSTPILIETDDAGHVLVDPQVAVDLEGNVTALSGHRNGSHRRTPSYRIWSNRYTPGGGWDTATLVDSGGSGTAANPRVAVDAQGNVMAVWSQYNGPSYVWASRYTPVGGWGIPILIEANDAEIWPTPQVAVDPQGNATAVWRTCDGAAYKVVSMRYTPADGWGSPVLFETDGLGSPSSCNPSSGNAARPQVAVDAWGNATAVWNQHDGVRVNVWSSRYTRAVVGEPLSSSRARMERARCAPGEPRATREWQSIPRETLRLFGTNMIASNTTSGATATPSMSAGALPSL